MARKQNRARQAGDRRRGSEVIEGMAVFLPFMAFFFLIVDTSWALLVRASLENAAQSAVHFAAEGGGQADAIAQTAANQSLVQLDPATNVKVSLYTPGAQPNAPWTPLSNGPGSVIAGNVVEVDLNYSFTPLAPLLRSGPSIPLTATASMIITSTPPNSQ